MDSLFALLMVPIGAALYVLFFILTVIILVAPMILLFGGIGWIIYVLFIKGKTA